MKKYLFIVLTALCLSACQQISQKNDSLSLEQKNTLKTCLMNKSLAAVQDGTTFTSDLSDLAQTIAQTCVKEQALQNLGIDEESASWAQTILSSITANQ